MYIKRTKNPANTPINLLDKEKDRMVRKGKYELGG